MPIAELETKRPMKEANATGRDNPAPIKIDPAISSEILFLLQNTVIAGTQYSSHMNANPHVTATMPAKIKINPLKTTKKKPIILHSAKKLLVK
jgi:hypothetical protein